MKRTIAQIMVIGLLLGSVSTGLAQTLSLEWDPNTEPDVAGYRLYYQAGSPQPPFLGAESVQGVSPIDVGPDNNLALELPDDGRIYYFAVTAYDDSGYESAYSNVIANQPRPILVAPAQGSPDVSPTVTFDWYHEVTDANTTYTLVYGSESEVAVAGFFGGSGRSTSGVGMLVLSGVGAWLFIFRFRRVTWCRMLVAGVFGACLISACGGGGGSSGNGTDPGTGSIPGVQSITVSGLTKQYFLATDLNPGQTYYWKVLAVDSQGNEIESEIFNFTTVD